MPLLLVRHAVALRRRDWSRPDAERPLTPRGYEQAEALAGVLAPLGVDRILSSPSLRCVETVQPLAARLGLPVEEVSGLGEGSGTAAARLIAELESATPVLCTHGDVLPALLRVLASNAALDEDDIPCAKASTWVVDDDRMRARYLRPPV